MKSPLRSAFVILLAVLVQGCAAIAPSEQAGTVQDTPTSPTSAPQVTPSTNEATQPNASSGLAGQVRFTIDPAASEVRFSIDEVLGGSPNTVIGATRGVSGDLMANPSDPTLSTVGPISIDAGSFVTDNGFRDRAIEQFILEAGGFPTLTFVSTSLAGIPATVSPGDSLTISLTGDLTIRDITRSVTFDVSLNVESPDRLTGTATATILRSDFGLTIPSVPQVAEVSEEITLQFDFTALRAS